jgi:hypothetical protein
MEPRKLAMGYAVGRVALGAALLAAPRAVAGPWVGDDARRDGVQVTARAIGARDVGIGLGQLTAARRGFGAASWLRAGALADAVDCLATLQRRDALPLAGVVGVAAMAAAGAALGAYLQSELD